MQETSTIILIAAFIGVFYWLFKGKPNPVEIEAEDPERLKNDAKRFARHLVAQIKLFNDYKVQRGLKNDNLYESLEIEIAEARKEYDKKLGLLSNLGVSVSSDYQNFFDRALIEVLADGDESKLGAKFHHSPK